jgi:hypothetical protein
VALLSRPDGVSFVACARFDTDLPYDSYRIGVNVLGSGSPALDVATAPLRPEAWLGQNVPNPFRPRTTIEYSLPRAQRVDLAIHDVGGRLVRRLVAEVQPSGRHAAEWDGRDASGARVAGGVYLYTLRSASLTDSRRLVLLK